MKKSILSSVCILFISLGLLAQTPSPTVTPRPADEEEVVKITTNLIQVDVTVTDSAGRVVKDLRPEEIEIFENGKKQDISNFLFVSSGTQKPEIPAVNKKPAVPVTAQAVRPEAVRRSIALVVDDISLSSDSIRDVRTALRKFVDQQMQDGDLVAIVRTGAGVGALQQFTADKRLLYAAIENLRWHGTGKGGSTATASIAIPAPALPGFGGGMSINEGLTQAISDGQDQDTAEFRNKLFALASLESVGYVVRGMRDLPGRKSIMMVSNGFKMIYHEGIFIDTDTVPNAMRRLADTANRASVSINTIDARGLQDLGFTAADSMAGRDPGTALRDRRQEAFDTQDGLNSLSDLTGGKAVHNTNDLGTEIRRLLDDQSYYLIGYQPDDETFGKDKKFNKLEVKVRRKDTTVRYRSGFFNVADEKTVGREASRTPQEQMMGALLSPFSKNDIALSLNVLFASDQNEGAYITPLLHVDGDALRFTDGPNGAKKAVFNVMGVIFGDNGKVVDRVFKAVTFTPDADEYKKVLENGFVYNLIFPVKTAGAYQFRVAIRDDQAGKIGSANQFIEIPDLKKNKLAVSSVILNNITVNEQRGVETSGHVMSDAAVKKFKKGSVLRYSGEIYNARVDSGKSPGVQTQIKIFRDEKLVMAGKPQPLSFEGQKNLKELAFAGALQLGADLPAGNYVLQVDVADVGAGGSPKSAVQWVDFEIVD